MDILKNNTSLKNKRKKIQMLKSYKIRITKVNMLILIPKIEEEENFPTYL
jgi:hypothetical protein